MLKISQAVIENGFAYTLLFYSRLARGDIFHPQ